ncbi:hypothetical protein [Sphingomonas sp. RS2018]
MNAIVKITRTAEGQSLVLPEGLGFEGNAVRVIRNGDHIVLEDPDAIDDETGLPMQRLRELIQEGLDSGPSEVWDVDEIKRLGRERLAQRP